MDGIVFHSVKFNPESPGKHINLLACCVPAFELFHMLENEWSQYTSAKYHKLYPLFTVFLWKDKSFFSAHQLCFARVVIIATVYKLITYNCSFFTTQKLFKDGFVQNSPLCFITCACIFLFMCFWTLLPSFIQLKWSKRY